MADIKFANRLQNHLKTYCQLWWYDKTMKKKLVAEDSQEPQPIRSADPEKSGKRRLLSLRLSLNGAKERKRDLERLR